MPLCCVDNRTVARECPVSRYTGTRWSAEFAMNAAASPTVVPEHAQ